MNEDSDSSSDEEEDEEVVLAEVKKQLDVKDSKTYLQFISTLRKFGRLSELRKARETYHELFLCTPTMWKEWLQDEMEVITNNNEKKTLSHIYKAATDGYYSFDLYIKRMEFQYDLFKNNCSEWDDIVHIFYHLAIIAGCDINNGSKIWKLIIDIHMEICNEEKTNKHLWNFCIRDFFLEQLRIPLQNSEDTLIEFEKWGKANPNIVKESHIIEARNLHNVASKKRYTREEREINLLALQETNANVEDLTKGWLEYINFEINEYQNEFKINDEMEHTNIENIKDDRNPFPVICLFERAIAQIPSNLQIWSQYISFLNNVGNISYPYNDFCFNLIEWKYRVHQMAVKNITYSSALYIGLMYSTERIANKKTNGGIDNNNNENLDSNKILMNIKEIVNKATASRLQNAMDYVNVLLSYCGIVKRISNIIELVRNACKYSCDLISKLYPGWNTGLIYFYKYQISVEISMEKNVKKARELWELILSDPQYIRTYNAWKEFINMERMLGNYKECRKLYHRAVTKVQDYSSALLDEWENFEREIAEDIVVLDRSNVIIKNQRDVLNKRLAIEYQERVRMERKRKFDATVKSQQVQNSGSNSSTNKNDGEPLKKKSAAGQKKMKKSKVTNTNSSNSNKYNIPITSLFTIYVCNIPANATKESFNDIFKDIDGYRETRLVMHNDGKSCKGFGYVDFKNNNGVTEGLKLDGTMYLDLPLKIRPYKKKELPKTVIFVSNIPPSIDVRQIGEKFKEYGTIIGIDLMKGGKGKNKSGRGVIEFSEETHVNKAMKQHNKLKFNDNDKALSITRSKRVVSDSGKMKWSKLVNKSNEAMQPKSKRKNRLSLFKPRSVV